MKTRALAWTLVILAAASCGGGADNAPPVAVPSITLSHGTVALGSVVELTYRFVVPPGAPRIEGAYRVFVHFLDADRELMWTDDHAPQVPTGQWTPGQTIEYTRTVFVPVYPYVGDATIEVGLYSDAGERLPLSGEDMGQRSYKLASLKLLPQTENIFIIYKDGWHSAEQAADGATEWQWTKQNATLAFRNPKRDVVFHLHLDSQPTALAEQQTVTVSAGEQAVDTFQVSRTNETIRKVAIPAALLGAGEMSELRISVTPIFVPSTLPASNNRDVRELGIRVFHAFVAPK